MEEGDKSLHLRPWARQLHLYQFLCGMNKMKTQREVFSKKTKICPRKNGLHCSAIYVLVGC